MKEEYSKEATPPGSPQNETLEESLLTCYTMESFLKVLDRCRHDGYGNNDDGNQPKGDAKFRYILKSDAISKQDTEKYAAVSATGRICNTPCYIPGESPLALNVNQMLWPAPMTQAMIPLSFVHSSVPAQHQLDLTSMPVPTTTAIAPRFVGTTRMPRLSLMMESLGVVWMTVAPQSATKPFPHHNRIEIDDGIINCIVNFDMKRLQAFKKFCKMIGVTSAPMGKSRAAITSAPNDAGINPNRKRKYMYEQTTFDGLLFNNSLNITFGGASSSVLNVNQMLWPTSLEQALVHVSLMFASYGMSTGLQSDKAPILVAVPKMLAPGLIGTRRVSRSSTMIGSSGVSLITQAATPATKPFQRHHCHAIESGTMAFKINFGRLHELKAKTGFCKVIKKTSVPVVFTSTSNDTGKERERKRKAEEKTRDRQSNSNSVNSDTSLSIIKFFVACSKSNVDTNKKRLKCHIEGFNNFNDFYCDAIDLEICKPTSHLGRPYRKINTDNVRAYRTSKDIRTFLHDADDPPEGENDEAFNVLSSSSTFNLQKIEEIHEASEDTDVCAHTFESGKICNKLFDIRGRSSLAMDVDQMLRATSMTQALVPVPVAQTSCGISGSRGSLGTRIVDYSGGAWMKQVHTPSKICNKLFGITGKRTLAMDGDQCEVTPESDKIFNMSCDFRSKPPLAISTERILWPRSMQHDWVPLSIVQTSYDMSACRQSDIHSIPVVVTEVLKKLASECIGTYRVSTGTTMMESTGVRWITLAPIPAIKPSTCQRLHVTEDNNMERKVSCDAQELNAYPKFHKIINGINAPAVLRSVSNVPGRNHERKRKLEENTRDRLFDCNSINNDNSLSIKKRSVAHSKIIVDTNNKILKHHIEGPIVSPDFVRGALELEVGKPIKQIVRPYRKVCGRSMDNVRAYRTSKDIRTFSHDADDPPEGENDGTFNVLSSPSTFDLQKIEEIHEASEDTDKCTHTFESGKVCNKLFDIRSRSSLAMDVDQMLRATSMKQALVPVPVAQTSCGMSGSRGSIGTRIVDYSGGALMKQVHTPSKICNKLFGITGKRPLAMNGDQCEVTPESGKIFNLPCDFRSQPPLAISTDRILWPRSMQHAWVPISIVQTLYDMSACRQSDIHSIPVVVTEVLKKLASECIGTYRVSTGTTMMESTGVRWITLAPIPAIKPSPCQRLHVTEDNNMECKVSCDTQELNAYPKFHKIINGINAPAVLQSVSNVPGRNHKRKRKLEENTRDRLFDCNSINNDNSLSIKKRSVAHSKIIVDTNKILKHHIEGHIVSPDFVRGALELEVGKPIKQIVRPYRKVCGKSMDNVRAYRTSKDIRMFSNDADDPPEGENDGTFNLLSSPSTFDLQKIEDIHEASEDTDMCTHTFESDKICNKPFDIRGRSSLAMDVDQMLRATSMKQALVPVPVAQTSCGMSGSRGSIGTRIVDYSGGAWMKQGHTSSKICNKLFGITGKRPLAMNGDQCEVTPESDKIFNMPCDFRSKPPLAISTERILWPRSMQHDWVPISIVQTSYEMSACRQSDIHSIPVVVTEVLKKLASEFIGTYRVSTGTTMMESTGVRWITLAPIPAIKPSPCQRLHVTEDNNIECKVSCDTQDLNAYPEFHKMINGINAPAVLRSVSNVPGRNHERKRKLEENTRDRLFDYNSINNDNSLSIKKRSVAHSKNIVDTNKKILKHHIEGPIVSPDFVHGALELEVGKPIKQIDWPYRKVYGRSTDTVRDIKIGKGITKLCHDHDNPLDDENDGTSELLSSPRTFDLQKFEDTPKTSKEGMEICGGTVESSMVCNTLYHVLGKLPLTINGNQIVQPMSVKQAWVPVSIGQTSGHMYARRHSYISSIPVVVTTVWRELTSQCIRTGSVSIGTSPAEYSGAKWMTKAPTPASKPFSGHHLHITDTNTIDLKVTLDKNELKANDEFDKMNNGRSSTVLRFASNETVRYRERKRKSQENIGEEIFDNNNVNNENRLSIKRPFVAHSRSSVDTNKNLLKHHIKSPVVSPDFVRDAVELEVGEPVRYLDRRYKKVYGKNTYKVGQLRKTQGLRTHLHDHIDPFVDGNDGIFTLLSSPSTFDLGKNEDIQKLSKQDTVISASESGKLCNIPAKPSLAMEGDEILRPTSMVKALVPVSNVQTSCDMSTSHQSAIPSMLLEVTTVSEELASHLFGPNRVSIVTAMVKSTGVSRMTLAPTTAIKLNLRKHVNKNNTIDFKVNVDIHEPKANKGVFQLINKTTAPAILSKDPKDTGRNSNRKRKSEEIIREGLVDYNYVDNDNNLIIKRPFVDLSRIIVDTNKKPSKHHTESAVVSLDFVRHAIKREADEPIRYPGQRNKNICRQNAVKMGPMGTIKMRLHDPVDPFVDENDGTFELLSSPSTFDLRHIENIHKVSKQEIEMSAFPSESDKISHTLFDIPGKPPLAMDGDQILCKTSVEKALVPESSMQISFGISTSRKSDIPSMLLVVSTVSKEVAPQFFRTSRVSLGSTIIDSTGVTWMTLAPTPAIKQFQSHHKHGTGSNTMHRNVSSDIHELKANKDVCQIIDVTREPTVLPSVSNNNGRNMDRKRISAENTKDGLLDYNNINNDNSISIKRPFVANNTSIEDTKNRSLKDDIEQRDFSPDFVRAAVELNFGEPKINLDRRNRKVTRVCERKTDEVGTMETAKDVNTHLNDPVVALEDKNDGIFELLSSPSTFDLQKIEDIHNTSKQGTEICTAASESSKISNKVCGVPIKSPMDTDQIIWPASVKQNLIPVSTLQSSCCVSISCQSEIASILVEDTIVSKLLPSRFVSTSKFSKANAMKEYSGDRLITQTQRPASKPFPNFHRHIIENNRKKCNVTFDVHELKTKKEFHQTIDITTAPTANDRIVVSSYPNASGINRTRKRKSKENIGDGLLDNNIVSYDNSLSVKKMYVAQSKSTDKKTRKNHEGPVISHDFYRGCTEQVRHICKPCTKVCRVNTDKVQAATGNAKGTLVYSEPDDACVDEDDGTFELLSSPSTFDLRKIEDFQKRKSSLKSAESLKISSLNTETCLNSINENNDKLIDLEQENVDLMCSGNTPSQANETEADIEAMLGQKSSHSSISFENFKLKECANISENSSDAVTSPLCQSTDYTEAEEHLEENQAQSGYLLNAAFMANAEHPESDTEVYERPRNGSPTKSTDASNQNETVNPVPHLDEIHDFEDDSMFGILGIYRRSELHCCDAIT